MSVGINRHSTTDSTEALIILLMYEEREGCVSEWYPLE